MEIKQMSKNIKKANMRNKFEPIRMFPANIKIPFTSIKTLILGAEPHI